MVDASTVLCGVIGNPIAHSMSPAMHNAAFSALGLNYVYLAFKVENVTEALNGVRALGIRGLSVTIPHKVAVMGQLDRIDRTAERIGAVNTIINETGQLLGTNTDGLGALHTLEQVQPVDGQRILILGVGGTSRAIGFTLVSERKPMSIVLAGRKPEKTANLAREIQSCCACPVSPSDFDSQSLAERISQADIVINTTPIGMFPNGMESPVPDGVFENRQVVFDAIYNPPKTRFLLQAEQAGARTINGLRMFVHQGAEQFRLWTGMEPPVEVMEQTVRKCLMIASENEGSH
ncbi:MAG TPA: shikimate dehydrogenase [bacterium]|nr:shikimate dehydrogenase [bacterium]HQQ00895.1 shikimate dehydrogenase [bacterium]